jgi:hypothetical protein
MNRIFWPDFGGTPLDKMNAGKDNLAAVQRSTGFLKTHLRVSLAGARCQKRVVFLNLGRGCAK